MSSKTAKKTSTTKKSAPKESATPEPTATEKKSATKDTSSLKKDTRLIPRHEFDWSRLVYSEPKKSEIKDGGGHYRRVYINYMYDDETIGPVIVEFDKKYCFGVQPDNLDKDGKVMKDKETGKDRPLKGYQMPLVMAKVSKESPEPTEEEQAEIDFLDAFRQEVVRYAVENKKAIGKGGKTDAQVEALVSEVLYRKKNEEGEIVADKAPTLYGKLIYYPNKKEVGTKFYGPGDKPIHPLTQKGSFYAFPNIQFECIFVGGTNISLQHRIYDATIEPTESAPKKRLARTNTVAASATVDGDAEGGEAEGGDEEVQADDADVNDMMESENEDE